MNRIFSHILYSLFIGMALTACNSHDELTATVTEHPNGAIELSAGIVDGGNSAVTRGPESVNHPDGGTVMHRNFENDTQFRLYVSGTWTNHGTDRESNPDLVYKTTTASKGGVTGKGNLHNVVTFSENEKLYWDDYGTAASNNTAGRSAGLTIYGVAINGINTAPEVTDWTALSCTLDDKQGEKETPKKKDLLISNNVQGTDKNTFDEGNYRFDSRGTGKLLEFKHALSKITVNLKPGTGFGGSFSSTVVVLTSNVANSTSNTEWAFTTGTVNITTGAVTSAGNPTVITMAPVSSLSTEAKAAGYTSGKEALVIPGSAFASDNAIIARVNADDNIYYVTAEKIRTAISSSHGTDGPYLTEAGKNYIINVIVNKTDIVVTATVADWETIEAAEVEPVINVNGNSTATTLGSDFSFSFYRSTSIYNGYSKKTESETYYPEESVVSYTTTPAVGASNWSMTPVLYWPNHNTHYQFRGVYPQTVITDVTTSPRVQDGEGTTSGCQVIKVWNEAYNSTADHFPSNLQIARPDVLNVAQNCGNNESGHTKSNLYTEGICAREGYINLVFQYMMSQVEVYLENGGTTASDEVDLSKVKVEVVDIYSTGDVKLGDMGVIPTGDAEAYILGEYVESPGTSTYTYDGTTKNGYTENKAIVPQDLDGVKFKITVTNSDGSTDVYMADVKDILKQGSTDKVTPNAKWESGYHYIYHLKLSKTAVKVTATLAEWKTVNAEENIWF